MYIEDGNTINNEIENLENENKEFDYNEYFLFVKPLESGEKTCNFIAFLEYRNNNIDDEIKRLQELKKKNNKKIDNAKKYLLYLNENKGLNRFINRSISIRNTTAVEVDNVDIDKIPEKFVNVKEVKTISKEKIKEYLNSPALVDQETGEVIPNKLDWARITTHQNINIK